MSPAERSEPASRSPEALHRGLTLGFLDFLTQESPFLMKTGGQGRRDYYGLQLENVSEDGSELDLVFTFRSGEVYCCTEEGCHIPFYCEEGWQHLRHFLTMEGLGDLPRITIRKVRVVVEEGAEVLPGGAEGMTPVPCRAQQYETGPYIEPERVRPSPA